MWPGFEKNVSLSSDMEGNIGRHCTCPVAIWLKIRYYSNYLYIFTSCNTLRWGSITFSSQVLQPLLYRISIRREASSVTFSNSNQMPECCQLLVPIKILGKAVDIGGGCGTFTQLGHVPASNPLFQCRWPTLTWEVHARAKLCAVITRMWVGNVASASWS